MKCFLCPRKCGFDRSKDSGFCGAKTLKVAKVMLHLWEEPIISCNKGSGAVFFSHCSLKCVYCQNHEISHGGQGEEISVQKLAKIFKNLEEQGACNINLVSPTHYTEEIIQALKIYRPKIPLVWNTSSYEEVETIEKLRGFVDVFLADLKYADSTLSKNYSQAENYFQKATTAILKMREIQPFDVVENGVMKNGIIVRHLILPSFVKNSIDVLNWIKENLGEKTYVSIMSQYTPCYKAKAPINRKIKPIERKIVLSHAISLGFENGFCQDISSATEKFIPKF